jgi:hypothetical protein
MENTMKPTRPEPFRPAVFLDHEQHPILVFERGRTRFHAIECTRTVRLVQLDTLRGLRPLERRGEPYPPRRAASYWLNHTSRPITERARKILRSLTKRVT